MGAVPDIYCTVNTKRTFVVKYGFFLGMTFKQVFNMTNFTRKSGCKLLFNVC